MLDVPQHPISPAIRQTLADIVSVVRLLARRSSPGGGGFPSRDEGRRGAVVILIALLLVLIIGFVTLGTEVALALWTQRQMQSAADDAALAAATASYKGYPSPYTTEAYALAAAAGFTAGQGSGCAATPTVYAGPPCDGTHSDYIEVLIRQPFTLSLAKVVFSDDFVLHGRAVAHVASWGCAAILDPTGSGALKVNGTADVTLSGCSAWVNSTASAAVQVEGGGIFSCDHLYVGGTATGVDGNICKTTTHAPTVVDPYKDVATPIPDDANCIPSDNYDRITGVLTLTPAVGATVVTLCKGINVGTGQTLNLCPGVYIIDGALSNSKFTVSGGLLQSVAASTAGCLSTGSGVAIVLTSSGPTSKIPQVAAQPGATMTLNGLAAAASGLPDETLFFQDRRAPVNQSNNFSGTTKLTGLLYFPSEPVIFNGNAATAVGACFEIIAWSLSIGGNPTLNALGCGSGTKKFGQPVLVE